MTGIQRALIKPGLNDDLRRLYRGQIQGVLNEAGVASVKLQPKVLAATFGRFDLTNPRAVEWARQKAATLVVAIEESTMQTIRTVIADGIQNGVPVRTTARKLRQSIGLTSRQWQSVNNFEDKLIKAGASQAAAAKGADRFSKVVLRRRAENIARTETIAAGIQGRFELWDQASDRGLIDKDEVKRKWIVTPDDRLDSAICLPMSGQIVGMEQPFITGLGSAVVGPPAHPQCRCDVILVIPGTSVFDDPPPSRRTPGDLDAGGNALLTTTSRTVPILPPGTTLPRTVTTRDISAVTPEEVFTRHPNLKEIRGDLVIKDYADPRVRAVVDDIALVSPRVLKEMKGKARFMVAEKETVPDMWGLPDFNQRQPRGWSKGSTWSDVRGGFDSDTGRAAISVAKDGGSSSVGLHEYGHAIGHNLREVLPPLPRGSTFKRPVPKPGSAAGGPGALDNSPTLKAFHRRAVKKKVGDRFVLPSYYRQAGLAGRQEMLAESTALYYKPPAGMTGKGAVTRFTGDADFSEWLELQLK